MVAATEAAKAPRGELLRLLGVVFGVAVSVGTIIGAGVLRLPGILATHVPDTAWLLLLWALGAAHIALSANLLSEIAAAVPKAGGAYVGARRAFGRFGGLIVGWADWLLYATVIAALSIASAEFLATLFPALATHRVAVGAALLVALVGLNLFGLREGRAMQVTTSLLKFALLCLVVVAAFAFAPADAPRFEPTLTPWAFALAPAIIAYQLIVAAYGGWSAPIYFAEENVDPGRVLPRAMFAGIVAAAAIYMLMNVALLYAVPLERLKDAPLAAADAVRGVPAGFGPTIVRVIGVISAVGCLNAAIMISSRILFGLSRDGLVPTIAARVNRGGSPDAALLITGALALALALSGTYEHALAIIGFYTVLISFSIDVTYFALRWREPELPRPYRAVGHPWLPALVLALDAALLIAFAVASPRSVAIALALLAAVIPIYLLTRRRPR